MKLKRFDKYLATRFSKAEITICVGAVSCFKCQSSAKLRWSACSVDTKQSPPRVR